MENIYWEQLNKGSHSLDRYITILKAVDSYYTAYLLPDKGTIISTRKEELTGKYEPLLNNFGVYLLIGDKRDDRDKTNIYVGQAISRDTVRGMDRLREHAENRNERYFNDWEYAVYITTENNTFDSAIVDTLEKMLIMLFRQNESVNCLNNKIGTSGNISREKYANAYNAIKGLIQLPIFGVKIDNVDEASLTTDTITEILNQYREQIRAEIQDSGLTQEQKEILEYHKKAQIYDEFRSHIEGAGSYIFSGRVYSMNELYNNVKSDEVLTPENIAKDMIDLLPKEVFNSKSKFLDIYSKSGVFLSLIIDKLMSNDPELPINSEEEYSDLSARLNNIVSNQLYGITNSLELNAVSNYNVLHTIDKWVDKINNGVNYALRKNLVLPNILCIGNFKGNVKAYGVRLKEYILEKFGMNLDESGENFMKFDVVIGNPPYNNDMYIDFVNLGHKLSKEYCCMITPAKWQAKGGKKNEQFRRDIVPYMSDIVYYPDCSDVFNIGEVPGISYFLLGDKQTSETKIRNICKLQSEYNDETIRNIKNRETLFNKGNMLNEKLKNYPKFELRKTPKGKRYQVWTNNKVAIGGGKSQGTLIYSNEGALQCLQISRLIDSSNALEVASIIADSQQTFSSDSKDECESFISWIYTKIVRYLLSINLAGLTGIANSSNDWWRFVPDPGKFDHIFTDEELYKKYNLTDEEIAIIESVIKERK